MPANWYYAKDNQQAGPVGIDALRELIRSGGLSPEDLVWSDHLPNWAKVREVQELSPTPAESVGFMAPAAAPVAPAPLAAAPAPQSAAAPQAAHHQYAPGAIAYESYGSTGVPLTPRALTALTQTKPWVRLFSVLIFIGAALSILMSVLMLMAGVARGRPQDLAGLVVMAPFVLLYVFPGIFLWRYASRIDDLAMRRQPMDLEGALEAQKSFWKFIGIVTLIWMIVTICFLGLALVVGMVAALGR